MEDIKKQEDSQSSNRSLRLDHEWVQVLINLRMKYAKSFTGKRNSANSAWNNILKEMIELGAPKTISQIRIKKKWMNLIAKYKQLKCEADVKQKAWPYFEQIDRAHSKKANENEIQNIGYEDLMECDNVDQTLHDMKKQVEKQAFTKTLIDLRYKYRYLFSEEKHTAQKSWIIIQNHLPSGDKYTTEQISKMWHNLVQRYKTLIENESDHSKITWAYFKQMHNIMSQIKNSDFEAMDTNITKFPMHSNIHQNLIEEHGNVPGSNTTNDQNEDSFEEWTLRTENSLKPNSTDNEFKQEVTSLNDILNYLKVRDQKRDEQMKEMMHIMHSIVNCLQQ
ncbi:hypothetical protein ILUMI_02230 [Ignelater luminosus]|uniref:Myb/SANT-like DNA-binding domain-containing protein n=1 Tax=Ignelater luminosus TaxID=2038154 RepID=A0A8K0GLJ0_IGNLU|nr:hypothetical protein ILUMI_02230 [Ignelater luminosus]